MTFRNPLRIFASASKLMAMKNLDETIIRRYVDILSDAGFKAVFGGGRNKDVLADMLNVLLPAHARETEVYTTSLPSISSACCQASARDSNLTTRNASSPSTPSVRKSPGKCPMRR